MHNSPIFPHFFLLFFPPLYSALPCSCPPALPSWPCLSTSAYCVVFPLLRHSLVCNGSRKVKSTEMLISKALAHAALEIRILVHYTRLLAEQSRVTRKHNGGARGLTWSCSPSPSGQGTSRFSSCKTFW